MKILFWIFIVLGILAFLKLKYLPLWMRIGAAIVAPVFLFGIVILVSWIFAFVLMIILTALVLGVFFHFKYNRFK